jgi:hypothetical protein
MLSIQLHAQNTEKNINRYYGLRVNKNLFGAWTITIQYTQFRIRGPSKLFFCDTLEGAKQRVQLILKRRLNYNRRMGCQYRIVHVDADPSVVLSEWIPDADLILTMNPSAQTL